MAFSLTILYLEHLTNYKQQFGKEGEELAQRHLSAKGLKLLALNFRHGHAEIDIVAKDNDTIVFVEVKTRETEKYGLPETAVSRAKMKKMAEGAEAYLVKNNLENECRYDIVSIIKNQYKTEVKHFEDAFWPGLY